MMTDEPLETIPEAKRKRLFRALEKRLRRMVGTRPVYCSDHLVEFHDPLSIVAHIAKWHTPVQISVFHPEDLADVAHPERYIRWGPMKEGEKRRTLGLTQGEKYP